MNALVNSHGTLQCLLRSGAALSAIRIELFLKSGSSGNKLGVSHIHVQPARFDSREQNTDAFCSSLIPSTSVVVFDFRGLHI